MSACLIKLVCFLLALIMIVSITGHIHYLSTSVDYLKSIPLASLQTKCALGEANLIKHHGVVNNKYFCFILRWNNFNVGWEAH
jgi:hypothetical protein